MNTTTTSKAKLLTVKQWTEVHSWPPEGGLRHLIFHAQRNGFDEVVVRVGRRLLIDEDKFFAWVAKQNSKIGVCRTGGTGNGK